MNFEKKKDGNTDEISKELENKEEEKKEEIEIKEDEKEKKSEEQKEENKSEPEKENESNNASENTSLKFQSDLKNILQFQEEILKITTNAKEKFHDTNQITKDQIKQYRTNFVKYGQYLKMIKNELGLISETMKKIKKFQK